MLSCRSVIWLYFYVLMTWCYHNQASEIARHFYYHIPGTDYYEEHNITISPSSYLTQRLINEITKQLLKGKLGYQNVSDKSIEDPLRTNCTDEISYNYQTTIATLFVQEKETSAAVPSNESCVELKLPPEILIDVRPSAQPVQSGFADIGSLGFSSRYGIYMSRPVVDEVEKEAGLVANTYTSLADPVVVSKFTAFNQLVIEAVNERKSPEEKCSDVSSCFNFDYSPPICASKTCAILLVGSIDTPKEELEDQIAALGLLLKVLYIEDQLTSLVLDFSSNINLLFFTRAPDVLTINTNFIRVRSESADCAQLDYDCYFPIVELRKLLWAELIKTEPLIYELTKNIHFNESEVVALLAEYASRDTSQTLEQFITDWLLNNSGLVEKWTPAGASEKPELIIGGFFPLWEFSAWKDITIPIAAEMAVKLVNANHSILKDHKLTLLVNDSQCDSSYVLKTFTQFVADENVWPKMVGGLGPACDDTAIDIAGLAAHYNYVMVSYAVGAIVLSLDRERYKYFYRTVPQIDEYAEVYVALFKELEWTKSKVSMLTDDSSGEFPVYHRIMSQEFSNQGITLATKELLPNMQYLDRSDYSKYLDKIKNADSYIIIMDVYEDVALSIMCEAYHKKMNMTYGYIWFLPDHFRWDWYDPDNSNVDVNCNKQQMEEAVTGYISLSHLNIDRTDAIALGGFNGTRFEQIYRDHAHSITGRRHASEYGSYAYDGVWTFATALDMLYKENPAYLKYIHTRYVAEKYLEKMNMTHFQGVSGDISFNNAGHRSGTTIIRRFNNRSLVDRFLTATTIGNWSDKTLYLLEGIQWGIKYVPPTTTSTIVQCEWEGLRRFVRMESCSGALLIAVIPSCILVILVIIMGAFCALRLAKRKYRMAAELVSKYGQGQAFGTFMNFDEKEIMRDHVVLNRKLGEGAFGTVYGGEAYINAIWTGVAVKTLKVGSNSEDKLDFLREADIMKRFEHKNIVKLLGVTTRGEPAYAIMEFMLYGDLKTYLLSRRELVGMDTKEVEDISASSLTRMALDVIEGLIYLHTKEYIHRDIACRNCLVSSNRTVKIGDFGMTRRVYDDGSYVFTRRGRLPVRWMAPESFVDGVFTYKTDVWSYGVLLYEIITFGSVPYHMLTNAEVFEGVKAGKTLTLPEECTDELKSLLLGCWNYDSNHRLNPYDLYLTLQNNENMVQPLLSCPALAKIRECDSVELDLSPTFLKTSTLLKKPFLRQSSSVISVDTGFTFSRHRNHSEISYRRSTSNRRRSSHSIIDLFSLVNPNHAPPVTPLSLPSPSHSTEQPTFHFPSDNKGTCPEHTCCESKLAGHCRTKHNSGSGIISIQPIIVENDYLLTTRSCTDIDDHSNHSHTPLILTGETAI